MQRVFSLAPADAMARRTMLGVLVYLVLVAVFCLWFVPVSARGILTLVWLPAGFFTVRSYLRIPHVAFWVEGSDLVLHGDLFDRRVPLSALRLSEGRRVVLQSSTDLEVKSKIMGTGLPGYTGGWYRLRGGAKALVYMTWWTKAVYLPTNLGYAILVSPSDPDGFLAALGAG